jgi:hypothetical protein
LRGTSNGINTMLLPCSIDWFLPDDHRRTLHGSFCVEDAGTERRACILGLALTLFNHPPPINGGFFIFQSSVGLKFAVCNHACD